MSTSLTIALVPLDERPVNTRYPQMLGAIGGAAVLLPPPGIRGLQRVPADLEAVVRWLQETSVTADAAVVSADFLGFGNLINARISQDGAARTLARLDVLADLNPICPVHAFSLITRVSNADDAVEEPDYWARWGTKFYRYARLTHQAERGEGEGADELARLEALLPSEFKTDWLVRRLRNHTVNLGLLDMAARGQITSLRLTSDDTSPLGFPSRERDWLRGWPRLIGPALAGRVMMHPGADEVGSALLSKLLMERAGKTPRVRIVYSHAGDDALVAPYEDRPVRETVEGQIRACGCVVADPDDGDFVLGVATPSPRRTDYRPEYHEDDRRERTETYRAFLDRLARCQARGVPVALADVAYPNGSDPLLTALLLGDASPLAPGRLAAYGAWNTAGNTLGVVVAQAACSLLAGESAARRAAQRVFLAHRFLEDWGYQAVTRREAKAEAERLWGRREPDPNDPVEQAALAAFIEERLAARLAELQARGIGDGLRLAPGSTRLPWRRTFEVDFALGCRCYHRTFRAAAGARGDRGGHTLKIIRYLGPDGKPHHAAHGQDGVVYDLADDLYGEYRITDRRADIRKLLAPVLPTAILGIGLNYRRHAAETNARIPDYPVVFAKTLNTVQNPDDPIHLPAFLRSDQVDYECELAVVIGRAGKNIPKERALDHVLGYTAANDVSARDWQIARGGSQWTRGKSFDTFCPLGPCLVTPDDIPNPNALGIRTILTDKEGNREVVQDWNTDDMIFDVPALIAFLSAGATLLPGTVILTGTPHGVGMARTPPRWLQAGDVVEVEVEKIGTLTNPVEDEP